MFLTIGKLAERAGVGVDTVRFYERLGLLPRATRSESGYRLFGEEAAERLRFIRRAKTLGFSLSDAAELLRLADGGTRPKVRAIAQARLNQIESSIRELTALRSVLADLLGRCRGKGTVTGCPIVESLSECTHGAKLDSNVKPDSKTSKGKRKLGRKPS
jgi:MerR family copper efflux transcriptional regulator